MEYDPQRTQRTQRAQRTRRKRRMRERSVLPFVEGYMKTEKHILMDMDGVIVRGATVIPGAPDFIARLVAVGRKFLVLTNNPAYTPRDLSARLTRLGIAVP